MKNFVSLLVFLVLLSSVLTAVFRHQVHRRESLRIRLIKKGIVQHIIAYKNPFSGLWKQYVAERERLLHGKFSNFKSTSQNIDDYKDTEYFINITIGTPDQLFSVIFDTANGKFMVPDISCKDCQNARKFNSSKSSTYQPTNYFLYNNSNYGMYGQDFVRFGNIGANQLVIPNTMFGQLSEYIIDKSADGILGLGSTAESPDGIAPPIINAINLGILDYPVVSIFLKERKTSSTDSNGGVITFGNLDTVNCDREVVYEPLIDPNGFEISVLGAALGSKQFSGNWSAILDTGSSFILAPPEVAVAFANEIGATYNYSFDAYTIDCNVRFNMNLTIGSTVYTLTEKNMVLNFYENICLLELLPRSGGVWFLGCPWFRTVCNILDYNKRRVGFANIINP